ncbi:ABC transporter substrate-binding protein [Caldimonas caldifontis]|uniref:ABC transporter substrate-binding protein n=1 Tax=Caldimonas caldifontis TaxID=1452508 RepID=A0A2S5SR18_9BURK|nr:ABC transporter substrate-binding protein [Caldimonas caldifontis]PPE65182.1 ABC transporter substrate-binding protein [Caldimonas caldifontis]
MSINRRHFVQATAAGAAAISWPVLAQSRSIKLGFVSPQTGPLAPFGEADRWVIAGITEAFKGGLDVGSGRRLNVQVVVKDSQSNPNRAGEVANDLILKDRVDLMLVSSTPETTNPVSDACELNEVPCISTVAPWQPWFFGRKGDPAKGFNWTYHFFWGLEDVIAVFTNLWNSVPTNKKVGGLFPNDGDGNAWGDPKLGFPPVLSKMGYTLTDPGRYQNLTQTFASHIAAFKRDNTEIITGVVIPPDMKTFLTQARQQALRPKVISVGKALLFPGAVEALGELGDGLSTEVWWTPSHPYKSSINGLSARQVADRYEADTKKQWTQPIGFSHALFEVAVDVLKRTQDPSKRESLRAALAATNVNTLVGPVKFGGQGPFKNVSKTPLVGGQWVKGRSTPYELVVVNNETAKDIPVGGQLKLMS